MCIFVKQAGRKFQGLSSTRNEATQVISKQKSYFNEKNTFRQAGCLVSIRRQQIGFRCSLNWQSLVTEDTLRAEIFIIFTTVEADGHLVS